MLNIPLRVSTLSNLGLSRSQIISRNVSTETNKLLPRTATQHMHMLGRISIHLDYDSVNQIIRLKKCTSYLQTFLVIIHCYMLLHPQTTFGIKRVDQVSVLRQISIPQLCKCCGCLLMLLVFVGLSDAALLSSVRCKSFILLLPTDSSKLSYPGNTTL